MEKADGLDPKYDKRSDRGTPAVRFRRKGRAQDRHASHGFSVSFGLGLRRPKFGRRCRRRRSVLRRPGYPIFGQPFPGVLGPLIVDQPVIPESARHEPGYAGDYGPYTGAIPYSESLFAPYANAAATSGRVLVPSPPPPGPTSTPAPPLGQRQFHAAGLIGSALAQLFQRAGPIIAS